MNARTMLREDSLKKSVILVLLLLIHFASTTSFAQYTKLVDFGSAVNGTFPYSGLAFDGTFLYGTTSEGGLNGTGTIYKIKSDGTGFTKLFDFDGGNGTSPLGSLFFDGTFLFGMTSGGGDNGQGTIFRIKPDGTSFLKVFDFDYLATGAFPRGSLISDGSFLYGMTSQGGSGFYGTVFKIQADGSNFTKLLEFNDTNGGFPFGSLITDGTFLFGMTSRGGSNGSGTIFKIKTDGTGYLGLKDFSGSDGSSPYGSLTSDGTFLYGATLNGGPGNFGTLFKIKPDATNFTTIVTFDNSTRGAFLKGTPAFDGTFLYGMTTDYGANGRGITFKVQTDGTGFTKLRDNTVGTNNSLPEGTLLVSGGALFGVNSGGGAGSAPFPPGTIFKINTDGSGYARLFSFDVEGNVPTGSLVSDGTYLYGMTNTGGYVNYGTVFKVKPDGTGYVRILDFDGILADGIRPLGSLFFDGTFLYGMTSQGGINDHGTVFKIKTDGSGYSKLLDLHDPTTGSFPSGSFISDGTFLYGMTTHGGTGSAGTIFKIMPDGTGYVKLLDLDYSVTGAYPNGDLTYDGTFLYGTTYQGGSSGWGTVFKIKPDGTGFSLVADFDYSTSGANPYGSLSFDGTFLYGTTSTGGPTNFGTLFKVRPDGTGLTNILTFDETNGSSPYGSLISSGGFFYGMTTGGGVPGNGTIFRIKSDGTGYLKMFDFNDGSNPGGSFITDGTFLYSTTPYGGANGTGTLFKVTLTPFVTVAAFDPELGVIGTLVTISGTGFNLTPSGNLVKFNGTTAAIESSTSTILTAFVPPGTTSGPISVTNGTTGTSISDFDVTSESFMFNGTVKNCNVTFREGGGSDDLVQTFLPVNPGDKVKVSWTSFNVGDVIFVYDGPTTTSPLLATLSGNSLPPDIVATGSTGALTFFFQWQDDTSVWHGTISCQAAGAASIIISPQPSAASTCAGGTASFTTGATGTTNITYQWQYASLFAGPFNDISNTGGYSNTSTPVLSVNTTGNFGAGFYRCKISGDLAPTVITSIAQLTVNVLPTAPTISNVSFCSNTSTTLIAAGGPEGQYKWYTVAAGGTSIPGQINSTFTTPFLTATTTYYVSTANGLCESLRTPVTVTIFSTGCAPVIVNTPLTTTIGGKITLNLIPLITAPNNNLDLNSLAIVTPPSSGAIANISAAGILTIDYNGKKFSGGDKITIKACDTNTNCSTQTFDIDVVGDITVFNGVSPGGANPNFIIQFIEVLPDTKENNVSIFDRWQNLIWHGANYNNSSVVFSGTSDSGGTVPAGVYFYKVEFTSGRESLTGFLSLRR